MTQINDTRGAPLQQNQSTGAASGDAPAPIIHCRDCRHWDRRWPKANNAQCLQAMKFGSSPLMTTDLQTCSQAEAR